MTEKELKSIMGKQFNFADGLMNSYKNQLSEGKLDVYSLDSMLVEFKGFSSLLKKPQEYKYFNLDNSAKFLLNNPFIMVNAYNGAFRGYVINPKETEVNMKTDRVFEIITKTYVNGVETFITPICLNDVYIVPFISVYCAMASLSRFINIKGKVTNILLSDGRLIMAETVFSNWELVSSGTVRVRDICGSVIDFSILDIIEVA